MTLGDCKSGDIVLLDGKRYRCMISYSGGAWGLREVLSPEGVLPGEEGWQESHDHLVKDNHTVVEMSRSNPTRSDMKTDVIDPLMG